jgi:type I restriction enzyme S subunit
MTWEISTIDEACRVEYGTRVVKKHDAGSKFPVYGGGDKTFTVDQWNREDRVVVSRFGMSPRCTRLVRGKFFLNDSGLTLSPRAGLQVLQAYLDAWTISRNDEIYSLGRGAAQKNLDVDAFRSMEFAYPTAVEEQQRIVDGISIRLGVIDEAEAVAQKMLEHYNELRSAISYRAVSPPPDAVFDLP